VNLVSVFSGHETSPVALDVCDRFAVSGSRSYELKLWDLTTAKEIMNAFGPRIQVRRVC
jgi:hypothetical protein